MVERLEAYFGKLEQLSVDDLDQSAGELALLEKQNVARLIAHISEISRRKVHLELGYKNLFDYGVQRLNLSEGAVWRRLQVARVCRRFPQLLVALSENRLNVTTASLLAPHLSEQNVARLLSEAEGKSKRAVEELLVVLSPKEEFKPAVRKLRLREAETAEARREGVVSQGAEVAGDRVSGVSRPGGQSRRALFEPATTESYNYRFAAGKAFTEKFERLAEVVGIEYPHKHMEEVFGLALEIALEKKDPKRKLERRLKREGRKKEKEDRRGETPRPGEETQEARSAGDGAGSTSPPVSRSIPPEVRERVLERAGYQCEYRGPGGRRCTGRAGLEIEHERPFAIFQSHEERTLRAFCRRHNRLSAERVYGAEFIRGKIEEKRRERACRARACQPLTAT